MCGIAGIFSKGAVEAGTLRRMIGTIRHRGPDDEGLWVDQDSGVCLGHRRLSIVDLSPAGHQPMKSHDGRFVISFNGEIYNHRDLRAQLEREGAVPTGGWRGHSDTETFLAAISAWGLTKALEQSVGMFAIAIWDAQTRRLSLVRDRFGEKPLYYGWVGDDIVFGSELKALRAHSRFGNAVSRDSLRLYTARAFVPAPFSIYERVFKVPPGCVLELSRDACVAPRTEPPAEGVIERGVRLSRYWSYRDVVRQGLDNPLSDLPEALDTLEQALGRAIRDESMADVPVGAFLSGGVDSSTIVALYQRHSDVPVRTYTIGFEEAAYNEANDARAVAARLGTVHHEHYVSVRETMDVIPSLSSMYDEPFADSSQIPTHLVSRFASKEVKVVLTGDGGDELFGGYTRHFVAPRLWRHAGRVPRGLRALAGSALAGIPSEFWSKARGLLPGRAHPHFGRQMQKTLQSLSSANSFDEFYSHFLDDWSSETSPVTGAGAHGASFDLDVSKDAPQAVRAMYCDAVSYLPDDILCKVDRASMAVSLETRVPFLDHRVAEVAARIPLSLKLVGGSGKHILRQLLYRYAPPDLFNRPKAGFAVPVGDWLRGPLRGWAEDLLNPSRLAADGWFDPLVVRRRWEEHLNGRRSSSQAIWALLMFQSWLRDESNPLSAAA
jgi:asparagine synthase (glutamine-hydrolysing)